MATIGGTSRRKLPLRPSQTPAPTLSPQLRDERVPLYSLLQVRRVMDVLQAEGCDRDGSPRYTYR